MLLLQHVTEFLPKKPFSCLPGKTWQTFTVCCARGKRTTRINLTQVLHVVSPLVFIPTISTVSRSITRWLWKGELGMRTTIVLLTVLLLSGCTSVGTLGIVTKSTGDPGAILRNAQSYTELGAVHGESCRFFLLAVAPWGDGTFSTAVENALDTVGGDAMINVTVSNSLYGFVPIYNIFSYTCTEVRGIAIKFQQANQPG